MRIGQVVYHRIAGTPQRNYAEVGHYNNQPRVMPSWETS
jgi:deoxycytidine triphosphate deaminase